VSEGLDGVTTGLSAGRRLQFYLTLALGLALGVCAVLLHDGTVELAASFFLIAMAFVMASRLSLQKRVSDLEDRIARLERARREPPPPDAPARRS